MQVNIFSTVPKRAAAAVEVAIEVSMAVTVAATAPQAAAAAPPIVASY